VVVFSVLAWCLASGVGAASEAPTREEAVTIVKRVQEKFKKDGPESTFKAVIDQSTKEFHDRNLYPFIYDLDGILVATGARSLLIGKNLIGLKDADGKYFVREIIAIAKGPGSGWVYYKYPNPFTGTVQRKSTYVERMGNYLVGVGIWGEGTSADRP